MTNLSRRRKTMKKNLWKIFKVVTFVAGIWFYIGLAGLLVESLKEPEPIVRPIMFMGQK